MAKSAGWVPSRWMADHPIGLGVAAGLSTAILALAGGADTSGALLGLVAMGPVGVCAGFIQRYGRRLEQRRRDEDHPL